MTRAVPFTQAKVTRAIAAARAAGLRVIGIRATDGVVLVQEGDAPIVPGEPERQDAGGNTWADR